MNEAIDLNGGSSGKKKIRIVLFVAILLLLIAFLAIFVMGGSSKKDDGAAPDAAKTGELAPIQDFEQMDKSQPAPGISPDGSNPNPAPDAMAPGQPAEGDYTQLCRDKFESEYRAAGFDPKDYPEKADEYIKACIDFISKNK